MVQPDYQLLIDSLKSAVGLLDSNQHEQLRQDVLAVCKRFTNATFRIAVFAPFNYGKSTLLNAMLGERALPIDLIPTTGAAICVKYGETLHTCIRFVDGTEINEAGTDVLKRFAILDENRCMRDDVASVEVHCPHPFLQTGVELLDLPGTDDREAQDALVRDQLLTADLVIQVLDARKLMTLAEREHLRDWLLDRGITNVIFVVNFLNLLEPNDQKQVYNRLRFVAESFRAKLPPNISNLYRVDALPALRARLKGNMADAQTAGLPTFESALHTIVQLQREHIRDTRSPRVQVLVDQVKQALQSKIEEIAANVTAAAEKQEKRLRIQQKAQTLVKQGFDTSITALREWLALPKLLDRYQVEATHALQQGRFKAWESDVLKPTWTEKYQTIAEWVNKACEFFNCPYPADLEIGFPDVPEMIATNPSSPFTSSSSGDVPVAIATGLGWVLGGPIGAAILGGASYLLNQNEHPNPSPSPEAASYQVAANAVKMYFSNFNATVLLALAQYEEIAQQIINCQIIEDVTETAVQRYQLQLLETTLDTLNQETTSIE